MMDGQKRGPAMGAMMGALDGMGEEAPWEPTPDGMAMAGMGEQSPGMEGMNYNTQNPLGMGPGTPQPPGFMPDQVMPISDENAMGMENVGFEAEMQQMAEEEAAMQAYQNDAVAPLRELTERFMQEDIDSSGPLADELSKMMLQSGGFNQAIPNRGFE